MSGTLALVRDMVATERSRGSKADRAFEDVACALGVSARWVRSVMRGEPAILRPARARAFWSRYRAWLAADIAKSERIIAERKKMLATVGTARVAGIQMDRPTSAGCLAGHSNADQSAG